MASGAEDVLKKLTMQKRRLKQLNVYKASAGAIKNVPQHSPEELQNIVRWNEFGTHDIPARSFLRGALYRNSKHGWRYVSREAVKGVLNGTLTGNKAYKLIGKRMGEDIKKQIDTIGPPNAPSTVRTKGRNQPLVDTGGLYRAIGGKAVRR